jgi:cell division transport system permease protein
MRAFPFLLREALVNLKRHGLMTVASVTTIAVSLALLGGFVLTFYQVSTAARRAVDDFEMRVFCRQSVPKSALSVLGKRIRKLEGVGTVRYLSKEDAFREQTRDLPIDLSGIPNQMNETFVVKLADPGRAPAIARTIRGWHREVQEVALPDREMAGVLRLANLVRDAGIVGAVVLLGAALVVVSNTIRISVFGRRREIKIMQLVGATAWFIRLPLLIEGLLHGLGGGALAGICLFAGGHYAARLIRETVPMLVPYGGPVDLPRFGLALVALGALIGASGSLVSMRRYLRGV